MSYHSNLGSRNYQMTSHFVHGRYASIFKRQPSSSFNSRFWIYYEVKQLSTYEFVKSRL